ncbi:winged helix-turn-helix domain-containing protein [candidate division KSB1 bacterium]|nr:winged helix-turn-helix domain-containing protein [candidate division KSB1 bacterium]
MVTTKFTEISFNSRSAERLRQIYSVLYFMRQGYSHSDAIHQAKSYFPKVADYQTIQDKCSRQFAGDIGTFLEWFESGIILSKLIELNKLDEHDARIFGDLLNDNQIAPSQNIIQPPATTKFNVADNESGVDTAFEIVLEEIENAIEGLNRAGAQAFEASDYGMVHLLRQKGSKMTDFRGKIYSLQKEWNDIFNSQKTDIKCKFKNLKRAKKLSQGLRTRPGAFIIPILRALSKMGGSASSKKVLDEIVDPMKEVLNEYDFSKLPSSGMPRWENTAHWARYEMVKEGLLAPDSPRGEWKITQKGRMLLKSELDNAFHLR